MELENITDAHRVVDPARQMLTKLQTFNSDFRKSHFDLIDLIDETDTTHWTLSKQSSISLMMMCLATL